VGVGVALGKKLIHSSILISSHPLASTIFIITAGAKSNNDGNVKINTGGTALTNVVIRVVLFP
jgi:hypothetical protein